MHAFVPCIVLVLAVLPTPAHAAAPPWANDTVLATVADRWRAQCLVVGAAALADLDASVSAALALLQGPAYNRTFSDIDYADRDAGFWPTSNHTVRVRALVTAWASPGSQYYNTTTALSAALQAFNWWLRADPQSTNWWCVPL